MLIIIWGEFQALGGNLYHTKNARNQKSITYWYSILISTYQKESKPNRLYHLIFLHHIAKNLPKTFTDNKGVTKSSYPTHNVPERMEVPMKTIHLPLPKMRGRSTATCKDNALSKHLRIPRTDLSSKSVNPSQKLVDTQWMSIQYQDRSPPKSTMHPNSDFGISEHPDSIIMGMTKSPKGLKFSHAILIPSNESII